MVVLYAEAVVLMDHIDQVSNETLGRNILTSNWSIRSIDWHDRNMLALYR